MKILSYIVVGWICISLIGCAGSTNNTADNFDRPAMLQNIADNFIVPGYDSLYTASVQLQQQVEKFTVNPSVENLESAQNAWKTCILFFQDVVVFDFGPADGLFGSLSENIGTFPTNVGRIESAITNNDTLLQNFHRDARGLLGIEYLLFAKKSTETVASFSNNARCGYARQVTRKLVNEISTLRDDWKNSYRLEFIKNSGTDAGSSITYLFNHLVIGFENIKNYKLGVPLGKRIGQSNTNVMLVEAAYSKISLELMERNFNAVMSVWYGTQKNGVDGLGFKEYLQSVEGGSRLITDTQNQEKVIRDAFQSLHNKSLEQVIVSFPSSAEPLYNEMQKMTRFLKSELSSLLGIAITYSSGDGD